jgi:cytidylate kinase
MAVITLSREFGSGGDEVASRLCEILGYHSFGKLQIIQAAAESTLSKNNIIDYSEDNHEVQSFLNRLFGRTASPVQKIAWSENPSIATRPNQADVHDTAVLSLSKRAIQAAGRAGNMVIIGRGGQVLLKDTPGVLHVRIEAPVEMRIERVKLQLRKEPGASQSEEKLVRAASDIIANREMASADYIKRYFNVDWHDPRLYHMVLNLGKLNVEQAVQIIVAAIHSLEMQPAAPMPL